MIIFDLHCDSDHSFEGWFRSAEDFEKQLRDQLVCCPRCDSHVVRRVPSAVAIGSGASQTASVEPRKSGSSAAALMPVGEQAMELYRQFVQSIFNSSEDVGNAFAEEARKIHYNEAPERPIRGMASADECEALLDEGIQVVQLAAIKGEDLIN